MANARPVVKYPGAKWGCAEWIVSCFPQHTHYLEPFFGSGVILFAKPPAAHEVVNDLDDNVVNLFRIIREQGEALACLIEMTPWARVEYELCKNEQSNDPLEQARRFLVQCWQGFGSSAGGRGSGWKNGGKHGADQMVATTWRTVPDRVRAVIERMRSVEIEHRPALEVIARYGAGDTLIYADPPYPKSVRDGRLYTEDDMTDEDHVQLLEALDRHMGPAVLSGYHCPLYDDRLTHWTHKEKRTTDARGQSKKEVLWLNPVCVERLGYGPLLL